MTPTERRSTDLRAFTEEIVDELRIVLEERRAFLAEHHEKSCQYGSMWRKEIRRLIAGVRALRAAVNTAPPGASEKT